MCNINFAMGGGILPHSLGHFKFFGTFILNFSGFHSQLFVHSRQKASPRVSLSSARANGQPPVGHNGDDLINSCLLHGKGTGYLCGDSFAVLELEDYVIIAWRQTGEH